MRFRQRLARTELVALLSLALVAGAMAAYSAIPSAVAASSVLTPAGSAHVVFLGTVVFGFVPVVLLGAPAYAWLSHRGLASWWAVLALAAWPSAVAVFLDMELAVLSSICGIAIAGITHLACRRWLSTNN